MSEYVYICVILALAGFVQGFSGFGSAIIALPLLAMVIEIKTAVSLAVLAAVVIGAQQLFNMRRQLTLPSFLPLLVGAVIGIPVGVLFLKTLPGEQLRLGLSLLLMAYAVYALSGRQLRAVGHRHMAYIAGGLSGWLGAAAALSGPPVILWVSAQRWSAPVKKMVIAMFLFVTSMLTALVHAFGGLLHSQVQQYFLVALAPLVVGTLIGMRLFHAFAARTQQRLIYTAVFLLGVLMFIQALV